MKFWVIYAAVIGLILLTLCFALSGCSALCSHQTEEPVITEPPTPGVQLWQAAKKSNWLVTLSILGVAAGVFALVNGAVKLGTASIASASVSLFMTLAVARYASWMAVFGLVGSVAAALFSILVRRKALVEIIKGVQNYRNENGNSVVIDKTLDENQTSSTKQIVQVIKNGLKLNGEIV